MKKYITLFCILLIVSCEKVNQNFESTTPNFEFNFHDTYSGGVNLQGRIDYIRKKRETGEKDYDLLKKKVYHDVRTINLKLNIKNRTGENIENAKLYTTVKFYYENDVIEYSFDSRDIQYDVSNKLWNDSETKAVDLIYVFNFHNNYNENIFKHKPNKIKATISLQANNSVGFNIYETVFDDDILINNFE